MSAWVGSRLAAPASQTCAEFSRLEEGRKWPLASWGDANGTFEVNVSRCPVRYRYEHLEGFATYSAAIHPCSYWILATR